MAERVVNVTDEMSFHSYYLLQGSMYPSKKRREDTKKRQGRKAPPVVDSAEEEGYAGEDLIFIG